MIVEAAGKPLSYTQNLEDYHLWLALADGGPGFYIDIGGGHPVADNVSLWFYERGWRGIVVEPQTMLADLYPHVRPRDTIHQGLIGRKVGTSDLHVFPRLHGLSTTVQAHAEGSQSLGDTYQTIQIPMLTLAALCETHGVERIDFLKIDVEGAEADVLAGNDWQRFRPKVIVIEAIDPATKAPSHGSWEPDLLAAGYTFRLDDTLNRFYVANECPDVLERLPPSAATGPPSRTCTKSARRRRTTCIPITPLPPSLPAAYGPACHYWTETRSHNSWHARAEKVTIPTPSLKSPPHWITTPCASPSVASLAATMAARSDEPSRHTLCHRQPSHRSVNGPILARANAGRAWIAAHHFATRGCFAAVISSGAISSSMRLTNGTAAMSAIE